MTKARRQIETSLRLVDVAIELLDARIPVSSQNPDIDRILKAKPRVVVLNKSDLADAGLTSAWLDLFNARGFPAVAVDSRRGKGLKQMLRLVEKQARPAIEKYMAKGRRSRQARCMVVGIPNVGKSMLINRLAGKKSLRTANRPGVTRGEQWIKIGGNLELLDTPGILWPKFEDPAVAFRLAATGAIREQIYDPEQVARELVLWLMTNAPEALARRYQVQVSETYRETDIISAIGAKRGFVLTGGRIDMYQVSILLIKEFREGKLGNFTLDAPE